MLLLKLLIYGNYYWMFHNNMEQKGNLGDCKCQEKPRSVIFSSLVIYIICSINRLYTCLHYVYVYKDL